MGCGSSRLWCNNYRLCIPYVVALRGLTSDALDAYVRGAFISNMGVQTPLTGDGGIASHRKGTPKINWFGYNSRYFLINRKRDER